MNQFTRIRWRLAGWNLVVLAVVLSVTIGTALLSEARARSATVDSELRLAAEREAATFEHDDDERDDDAGRYLGSGSDILVYRFNSRGQMVRNARQASLDGLPDSGAVRVALGGQETLANRDIGGGVAVRLLTVPVTHDRRVVGVVQVGKPLAASQEGFRQLTAILLLTGGLGLGLSALGSLFLADRAMRPIRDAFTRQRQFIADASHELRTPVAVVRARAHVLQRDGADLAPDHVEQLRLLRRDADDLSLLLDDLLDLARLDAGQIDLPVDPVALADVVEELVDQLEPLATERGVHLRTVTQPVWGQANLGRLRQVLRALVDNALKHTPRDGTVEIAVDSSGDWARMQVIDSGTGIAPEHLPRATDRFYRVDDVRSRGGDAGSGGAGLGLAIATELIRLMRGRFSLESAPGHGTTATVLLPQSPKIERR